MDGISKLLGWKDLLSGCQVGTPLTTAQYGDRMSISPAAPSRPTPCIAEPVRASSSLKCSTRISLTDTGEIDVKFNCTPAFPLYLTSSGSVLDSMTGPNGSMVGIQFFKNAARTKNISSSDLYSPQNPLYFGTWATAQESTSITYDPDIIYGVGCLGALWVLDCSSTVYEATYTWVNGTFPASARRSRTPV